MRVSVRGYTGRKAQVDLRRMSEGNVHSVTSSTGYSMVIQPPM